MPKLNKIHWMPEHFSITQERGQDKYLFDRHGIPFYKYPSTERASFEITGKLEWEGQAWSKEKIDGLVPFLTQKLREYEECHS